MSSTPAEPPTFFSITSAATNRSYSCYNCNRGFHISPTSDSSSSPSSFLCPQCLHLYLIPHHNVAPVPPPPPPPSPTPPPPPPPQNYASTLSPGIFTYYTFDDSDSGNVSNFSLLDSQNSVPALKSFVNSLPIKIFPPNSTRALQSCSICIENFGVDLNIFETVLELPCTHYFHKDCIVEWLNHNHTCPLCRYKLPRDPGVVKKGRRMVHVTRTRTRVNAELSITSVVEAAESGSDGRYRNEAATNNVARAANNQASTSGLALARVPRMRRVNAEVNLAEVVQAAESGSDWRYWSTNGGERSRWFEPTPDEDGDILMVDA